MNVINATSFHVFDEIAVDQEHAIGALRVDKDHNIYAMSDRKVEMFHQTFSDSFINSQIVVTCNTRKIYVYPFLSAARMIRNLFDKQRCRLTLL